MSGEGNLDLQRTDGRLDMMYYLVLVPPTHVTDGPPNCHLLPSLTGRGGGVDGGGQAGAWS